jgi:hypothetical protein
MFPAKAGFSVKIPTVLFSVRFRSISSRPGLQPRKSHRRISFPVDQQNWLRAPMLAQLNIDWLVEVTSEHYYGPTTVGAIQEFIRLGDINADTFVINACAGTRRQIGEMPALFKLNTPRSTSNEVARAPASAGISICLQERVRDLEQTLRE